MNSYEQGEWVKIETLGELKKALQMFPNSTECKVQVRFMQTTYESEDDRSINSIQFSLL